MLLVRRVVIALIIGSAVHITAARAADPSALWKIINDQCVPHEQTIRDPAPCALVDLSEGVAKGVSLLKDINGVGQFLLIPTARISGIEDPAILTPDATNYWNAAWQARYFVGERLHAVLQRDDISLAINSAYGRSQNQLHIHIDCVRADVRDAVKANIAAIGDQWSQLPVTLAGHDYRAIRINQETLDDVNPFKLLAEKDPDALADMGQQTLVLLGETFPDGAPGFVLLNDHVDLPTGDRASGEQLQDHDCAIVPR